MDEIDWVKVKSMEKILKGKKTKETENEVEETFDEITILKKMSTILQAKETVTAAMKRLGKSSGGAGKWKNKRPKTEGENSDKVQLDDLISCADKVFSNGNLSIYQYTLEEIQQKIKTASEKQVSAVDSLDMFGEAEPVEMPKKGLLNHY